MSERYSGTVKMRCPNEDEAGHAGHTDYDLAFRTVTGGAKFRCSDCLVAFTMSQAQVRRLLVRRETLGRG